MCIFDSLKKYAEGYELAGTRNFTPEEISAVSSAKVVPSTYGLSVCFVLKAGGQAYIPVSRDSTCQAGDVVDMTKAKVLKLTRDGESIDRVEV